jgi:hypothetical protein
LQLDSLLIAETKVVEIGKLSGTLKVLNLGLNPI